MRNALLQRSVSALFALTLAAGCFGSKDRDEAKAKKSDDDTEEKSEKSKSSTPKERTPLGVGPKDDASKGDAPTKDAPKEGTTTQIKFVESKLTIDDVTGDPKEDTWRYFRIWGEFKNESEHVLEDIVGDIRYFDASGKELGIDSISTGVKEDVGDASPGERVGAEVSFIQPGATVPMEHIRSLNKIGGKIASYKIDMRPARIVASYPKGTLSDLKDEAGNMPDDSLPGSSALDRRVISGTIKNEGKAPCAKAGLVIGFYDASGKLADLKDGDAATELLEPGATSTVKVYTLVGFDDAWKEKATFKAWVRCSEPY